MEVGHKGADIAGGVLLGILPLALTDVIDVAPQPLGPVKVARIVHRIYLTCALGSGQIYVYTNI